MDLQMRIMDSTPMPNQKQAHLGTNRDKGVAIKSQRKNIDMQDPFYAISNPNMLKNYSSKTIAHISNKFT